MFQNVFILGATGKVGGTLVEQIFSNGDTDSERHRNPTRIVGLASSTSFVYNLNGIDYDAALPFLNKSLVGERYSHLDEILNKSKATLDNNLVFVDATACGEEMLLFHNKVINSTPYGIVTANKNPLTLCDFQTFNDLTREVGRYGYRCSVMAGAEAVEFLRDSRDLGDTLKSIDACLSGTLGYISTKLHHGIKFSEAVHGAMINGYMEPNPMDDLSGVDVARKMTILARTAGFDVSLKDISRSPFVPESYLGIETNDFLRRMPELDEDFYQRARETDKRGKVLRYVAKLQTNPTGSVKIGLVEVPTGSELGILRGRTNKIIIETRDYGEGYVVSAPGAGLEVTARNIRRDLLSQLERRFVMSRG